MVTECAYGQLKGRWRVLMRKCESPPETARMTTLACIVLHNVCIGRGDTISKNLDLSIDPAINGRRNRDVIRRQLDMTNCQRVCDNSCQAACIRNALFQMFWEEKQIGSQTRLFKVLKPFPANSVRLNFSALWWGQIPPSKAVDWTRQL